MQRCWTILCHITILSKTRCLLASCLITNWLVFMLLLLRPPDVVRSFLRSFVLITKLSLLVTGIPIRLAHSSISSISPSEFFSHVSFLMRICLLIHCFRFSLLLGESSPERRSSKLGVEDRAIRPRVLRSKDDFRFFRNIRFSSNPRPVLSLSLPFLTSVHWS